MNCLLVFGGRPNLHSNILNEIQRVATVGKKHGLVREETNLAEYATTDGAVKKNPSVKHWLN